MSMCCLTISPAIEPSQGLDGFQRAALCLYVAELRRTIIVNQQDREELKSSAERTMMSIGNFRPKLSRWRIFLAHFGATSDKPIV